MAFSGLSDIRHNSVRSQCFCSYSCEHTRACVTHILEHVFMSVFHAKRCILIRSRRPFRGSNPPGCDFPPLVLWGWGDWDFRPAEPAALREQCYCIRPPTHTHLSFLTFLDILMMGWVRTYWSCCHGKSFTIWHPDKLGICECLMWCCCASAQDINGYVLWGTDVFKTCKMMVILL